jgi:hypothetical protein
VHTFYSLHHTSPLSRPRRLHEALEREVERHAVRRAPLGCDREGRCYWWGLAGHSSSLLVQQDGPALEAAYTRLTEAAAAAAGGGGVPHPLSAALQGWREGLAAVAAAAGPDEAWGDLGSLEGVEALLARCDVRGAREKELKAALERVGARKGGAMECAYLSKANAWLQQLSTQVHTRNKAGRMEYG